MQDLIVASYNVHKCVGFDRRFDPARTLRVIAEIAPDIIALQEADRRFGDRVGLLDLSELRARTGLVPVPLPANDRAPNAHGWHGNLVLVREAQIEDVRPIRLPGLEPRGAVMIDLVQRGGRLRVVAAHLGLLRGSRLAQARALAAALEAAADGDDRPAILMGDLNEWRRRKAFGPLDARKPATQPPVPSFPARLPVLPLDRIMGCAATQLSDFCTHDSPLARMASDHLPVKARLRLLPGTSGGARAADSERSARAGGQR